jgi:hypothetical protein
MIPVPGDGAKIAGPELVDVGANMQHALAFPAKTEFGREMEVIEFIFDIIGRRQVLFNEFPRMDGPAHDKILFFYLFQGRENFLYQHAPQLVHAVVKLKIIGTN